MYVFMTGLQTCKGYVKQTRRLEKFNQRWNKISVDCLKEECYICADWGNARPEEGGEHHLAYW